MVGNDIIDIKETKRLSNWQRAGFLQKIFTVNEQDIIASSINPFNTVWRLWSMKESAYKVFIQAGGKPFFNPTKIECNLISLKTGVVKIDSLLLKTNTLINEHYIFSTALLKQSLLDTCVLKLPEKSSLQQSDFMYQEVLKAFAINNELQSAELSIKKMGFGIPTIFYKNIALNTSISITHHGKYGAYSIFAK